MHRFTMCNGIKQTLEGILLENFIYIFVVQHNREKNDADLVPKPQEFFYFGNLLFCLWRGIGVTRKNHIPREAQSTSTAD